LSVHHAFALHRTFSDGAITHLLRAGVVSLEECRTWDATVASFWEQELGHTFTPDRAAQLFLPLKLGGLGFQSAEWRRSSAFLGSWSLCLSAVASASGFSSLSSFRAAAPFVVQAINANVAELQGFGFVFKFDWSRTFWVPARRVQKFIAREVHEVKLRQLLLFVSEEDRIDIRSAGGPGSGAFLLPPTQTSHTVPDLYLKVALRRRLRFSFPASASVPAAPSHCKHRFPDGSYCGAQLDDRSHHAGSCKVGGGVLFGHNQIRDWLAAWLERMTGRRTATEQFVSAWDTVESVIDPVTGAPEIDPATGQPRQRVQHAKLDNAFDDAEGRRSYVDVEVVSASSASSEVRARRACADGVAAAEGVAMKQRKYPAAKSPATPLVPFVVESLGRLSEPALGLLRSVAPVAAAAGAGVRSRELRSAQQELSALVQIRLAEQLLSAEVGRGPSS
jgi:hypothetical protein